MAQVYGGSGGVCVGRQRPSLLGGGAVTRSQHVQDMAFRRLYDGVVVYGRTDTGQLTIVFAVAAAAAAVLFLFLATREGRKTGGFNHSKLVVSWLVI